VVSQANHAKEFFCASFGGLARDLQSSRSISMVAARCARREQARFCGMAIEFQFLQCYTESSKLSLALGLIDGKGEPS